MRASSEAGLGSSSCDGASPVPGLLALPEMDRSLHVDPLYQS